MGLCSFSVQGVEGKGVWAMPAAQQAGCIHQHGRESNRPGAESSELVHMPTPPACAPHPACRCQLIQGKPSLRQGSGYTDFVWVAKDELGDYITHQPTLELLQKML